MVVPPELPDEENKILETLKSGDRIEHFETVRVSKTGRRINVSLTISPIKDSTGRTVGISGIARDITERKLADEARLEVNRTLEAQAALLQSREELLKIFVKHVPAAVAMLDRDMRYLQVSDAGARIIRSTVRRFWDVRTTKFSLTFPNGGKRFTSVVLREKRCE